MSGFSPEENLRFGHRLAISRAKAGYTQKSFAQAINFNQCEITLYERGLRFPTDETLKKLADMTHVDPYWLKYGDCDAVDFQQTDDGTEIRVFHPKNGKSRMKKAELDDLGDESRDIAQSVINALAFYESPEEVQKAHEEEEEQFKADYRAHRVPRIRNDPNKLKKMIYSISKQYFPELNQQLEALGADYDVDSAAGLLRTEIEKTLPDLPDEEDDLAYFSAARKQLAKIARRNA